MTIGLNERLYPVEKAELYWPASKLQPCRALSVPPVLVPTTGIMNQWLEAGMVLATKPGSLTRQQS